VVLLKQISCCREGPPTPFRLFLLGNKYIFPILHADDKHPMAGAFRCTPPFCRTPSLTVHWTQKAALFLHRLVKRKEPEGHHWTQCVRIAEMKVQGTSAALRFKGSGQCTLF